MIIRKHLSWLLVILLVITMTGQAALAYSMSCQGTSTCCCVTPAMDMTAAMPDGMSQSCCDTTPSQPCDIGATSPVSPEPYLSGFAVSSADPEMTSEPTVIDNDPGNLVLNRNTCSKRISFRGGPPIYLQIQSFLC